MIEDKFQNLAIQDFIHKNITILTCLLIDTSLSHFRTEIASLLQKAHMDYIDENTQTLTFFYIDEPEEPIINAINLQKELPSSSIIVSIHSDFILDKTDFVEFISIAEQIIDISKDYGISIGVSQSAFSQLSNPNRFNYRFIENFHSIPIFDFIDGDALLLKNKKMETISIFEDSVFNFYRSRFPEAYSGFTNLLQLFPEDKASKTFIEKTKREL
ncbi:MAG: hypothetical protein PF518_08760 [Spirochaetaceae bacterium]|nr:hypothetical protein [Spirochaetaceae bacterium]